MTNIVPRIGNSSYKSSIINRSSNNDNSRSCFKDNLANDAHYAVSRLKIPARCNLPLQRDLHTSKHLTVLSGIIHITLADDIMVLVADESIYVPQGVLHGLENRADNPALIISVDYIA